MSVLYTQGVADERKRCAALVELMLNLSQGSAERWGGIESMLEQLLDRIECPSQPLPELPFPHHPNAPEDMIPE